MYSLYEEFYCCVVWINYVLILPGKLASRSQRVAHYLLNKLGGGRAVVPGDRVRHGISPGVSYILVCAVLLHVGGLDLQPH